MFNPPGMQPFPPNPALPRANIIYPSQIPNPNVISAPPILTAPKVPAGMVVPVPPPPPYPMMVNPMSNMNNVGNMSNLNSLNNLNPPNSMPNNNPSIMSLGPPPPFNIMGTPGFVGGTPVMPVLGKSDTIKKVFVKNIPNDVPDEFMESILKVKNFFFSFILIFCLFSTEKNQNFSHFGFEFYIVFSIRYEDNSS
jgi:hypothetical protein